MEDMESDTSSAFVRNGVLHVGKVEAFPIEGKGANTLAALVAAHAVYYLPFRGPCRVLFELVYKVWGFQAPLSKAAESIRRQIYGVGR